MPTEEKKISGDVSHFSISGRLIYRNGYHQFRPPGIRIVGRCVLPLTSVHLSAQILEIIKETRIRQHLVCSGETKGFQKVLLEQLLIIFIVNSISKKLSKTHLIEKNGEFVRIYDGT